MSRTVEIRLSRLIVAGLALLALGLVVGWRFLPLGDEEVSVDKVDGQLFISPKNPVGEFESATDDDAFDTLFIVEDLYWEDGAKSGYGPPPCLDNHGSAGVHAGMVHVHHPGSHHQIAWVRCP